MTPLTCFKANDIRGRLGVDLDEGIAHRIGRAFARALDAKTIILGHDNRASSPVLNDAVAAALVEEGCEVLTLGLSGTEEMYHATEHMAACGGLCITASHNPIDYNGMKLVGKGATPLNENQFRQVRALAEDSVWGPEKPGGKTKDIAQSARASYVDRVTSFADITSLKPLKILVNAGHGTAGPTFDAIAQQLEALGAPLTFERLFHTPDNAFPQGIPNPLLPENHPAVAEAVRQSGADFGVAWDGDFDRCFFFDHRGNFIDGEYVVGLLAQAFLVQNPGEAIIHDPRVVWNTRDVIAQAGGHAVQSRTGHAFIKQAMRIENAIYGGEMSAHHYFRDFAYCDSGMIPWILVANLVSRTGPLADQVAGHIKAFPSSGELNFTLQAPDASIDRVRKAFVPQARDVDETDGLSVDMGDWRFNLRRSNTEPVVRLNVEARGSAALVKEGVAKIKAALRVS